MRVLDQQEKEIIRQLVRDPRLSDNQVSKNTQIPLKTVNRKRKALESQGLLSYFAYLNSGPDGTGLFGARQLLIITFRSGISRQKLIDVLKQQIKPIGVKHMLEMYLGEADGRNAVVVVLESRLASDFVEILNVEIVPLFKAALGEGCIHDTRTIGLGSQLAALHNYLPLTNMERGRIKEGWPNELIFVE